MERLPGTCTKKCQWSYLELKNFKPLNQNTNLHSKKEGIHAEIETQWNKFIGGVLC